MLVKLQNAVIGRTRGVLLIAVFMLMPFAGYSREETSEQQPAPQSLTGNWPARVVAEEHGVIPFAVLKAEAWGNVDGGLSQRGWLNSLLDFGFELDTGRLKWWEGGTLMVQAHWVENLHEDGSFDRYVGGFNPVSSSFARDHIRIYNLHYRHSWKEELVQLKVGQLAVDDDFMLSEYTPLFLNSAFGPMPSQVGTPLAGGFPAFPIYSVAAPGVFLRVQPVAPFYTQLGLYHGHPGPDQRDNYGFDWASQSNPGMGLFWESGYAFTLGAMPGTSRFGLSYHTGHKHDFSAITPDDTPIIRHHTPDFYLVQDLGLLLDSEREVKLGAFARAGITPDPSTSVVSWYVDSGLNWFGPVPGREEDVAGLAVSHTRFSGAFRESVGGDGVASAETTLELTYQARLTRWMVLQADVQFLFSPAVDPGSGSRETATILGLRAEITF